MVQTSLDCISISHQETLSTAVSFSTDDYQDPPNDEPDARLKNKSESLILNRETLPTQTLPLPSSMHLLPVTQEIGDTLPCVGDMSISRSPRKQGGPSPVIQSGYGKAPQTSAQKYAALVIGQAQLARYWRSRFKLRVIQKGPKQTRKPEIRRNRDYAGSRRKSDECAQRNKQTWHL